MISRLLATNETAFINDSIMPSRTTVLKERQMRVLNPKENHMDDKMKEVQAPGRRPHVVLFSPNTSLTPKT